MADCGAVIPTADAAAAMEAFTNLTQLGVDGKVSEILSRAGYATSVIALPLGQMCGLDDEWGAGWGRTDAPGLPDGPEVAELPCCAYGAGGEAGWCDHVGVRFTATARDGGRGRVLIPVPFDPDEAWTAKSRHHVGGTVNGCRVRGVVERHDRGWGLLLGPAWLRGGAVAVGDEVELDLEPEGPQRSDLADDVAAALAADPAAGEFFDGLAQFYRRGYLRWIEATRRDPAELARRIARTVELLAAGSKDHRQR
jgi:Bacteriocin-protection, YdeI or OmpD-Associated/Domain of unknown function (DUF1905)